MAIELDHIIVHARDKVAAAKRLAEILDVPWSATGVGPFAPVFVSTGLTLDFVESADPFPVAHYAFRVSDAEFDAVFARIKKAGLAYGSQPHDPTDMKINTSYGGRLVYWTEPEGHMWEILTRSYARQPPER